LNPKQRGHKYAQKDKGVKPDDLQGLQGIHKAEVSKYNKVKNTNSAYSGQHSQGRAFLKNLVTKKEKDEANGPINDALISWQRHSTMDHLTNIQHLHWRCLSFRSASMKAVGKILLKGFPVHLQNSGITCMSTKIY